MNKIKSQPLVSIIIPTFNREHIIVETLNSINSQSYVNFECIIVDDGSSDNTDSSIEEFSNMDSRFFYIKRPSSKVKGANSCRNIGLERAKGDYIIFFDSDDLMNQNHIMVKMNAIIKGAYDYVITKTLFFNDDLGNTTLNKNYNFTSKDITAYNYISQKINWLTYDVCIKYSLAKSISFNEKLQSGQEYNYFAKLVLKSTNAVFVDKVVTYRRAHENSIQGQIKTSKQSTFLGFYNAYWNTYVDVKYVAIKSIRKLLAYKCYKTALKIKHIKLADLKLLSKTLLREFGLKGIYYSVKLLIYNVK